MFSISLSFPYSKLIAVLGFATFMFYFNTVEAQKYEVGLGIGGLTYTGDMVKEYRIENNRPAGMAFFRMNLKDYLSVRAHIMGGFLYGDDEKPIDAFADARNAPAFGISYFELGGTVEYYFLDFRKNINLLRWSPYFFLGLGAGFFGQHDTPSSENYSNIQPVVPLGIGFKYLLNREWSVGMEAGIRKTFFDYADNLSGGDPLIKDLQYGNKYDTDWLYFIGFSVSYTFYTIPCPFDFN